MKGNGQEPKVHDVWEKPLRIQNLKKNKAGKGGQSSNLLINSESRKAVALGDFSVLNAKAYRCLWGEVNMFPQILSNRAKFYFVSYEW